jgi:hypothetical protein
MAAISLQTSDDRQQSARSCLKDEVDLRRIKVPALHEWHHVAEDVPIAMTAATRQARLKADVVRNRNLGQMPPVNQFSQET